MSTPGVGSPSTRRRWWLWAILAVVILGVGGGGYFAYSRGYVSIPFLSPKPDELFSKMIDSIGTINEAQYTIQGHLVAQPRAENAEPLFVKATNTNTNSSGSVSASLLGVSGPEDALRYMPADINATGSLTLYGESADTVQDSSGMIHLAGSYAGSDSSMQLDFEIRKIKDTVYAIVQKFPGFFFFDFTALKDKWVKIAPEDVSGLGLFDVQSIQRTKLKENVEKLRQPLQLALKQGVVTVGKRFGNENITGVQSQHIRLAVHSDKIVPFLKAWADELRKDTSATDQLHSVETLITNVEKPGTLDTLNRVIDHSTIDLWIDRNHSLLRQIQWTFTIIPPDGNEKLKDKQFELQLGLLLEKVNEKVKIDEPDETISFDEAQRLLTGVSVESQQFSKQTERIQDVRSALTEYKKRTGAYPDSLDQVSSLLTKAYSDCQAKLKATETSSSGNPSARTRDALRQSDVSQIRTGLALYYDDHGSYPATSAGLAPTYISKMPVDPSTNAAYTYEVCSSGTHFLITANQETSTAKYYVNDAGVSASASTPLTCGASTNTNTNSSSTFTIEPIEPIGTQTGLGSTDDVAYKCSNLRQYQHGVNGTDVYTSKSYGYTKDGDNFKLTYQLKTTGDIDSYNKDSYADGQNTATSTDQSIEKVTTYENNSLTNSATTTTDSDSDGLTDAEERTYETDVNRSDTDGDGLNDYEEKKVHKTNPFVVDTDGDSYPDGQEVKNSYNPNGAGKLE